MVREEIVLGHEKCLCMRAYVEHRRVDTQQAQEPIVATQQAQEPIVTYMSGTYIELSLQVCTVSIKL